MRQLDALRRGDKSIYTIYKPPNDSKITEQNKQVLNILKLHPDDEDIEKHPFDKTLEGMPTNFQDLLDHPTLTDKAFSKFREYVKLNYKAIFD